MAVKRKRYLQVILVMLGVGLALVVTGLVLQIIDGASWVQLSLGIGSGVIALSLIATTAHRYSHLSPRGS